MVYLIMIAACITAGYAGFYFGYKKGNKNSLTKEECAEIQQILNLLNYDGREQK